MIEDRNRRVQGGSRPFRDTPQTQPPVASGAPPQSQAAVAATQPEWTLPYQRGPRVETTMPPGAGGYQPSAPSYMPPNNSGVAGGYTWTPDQGAPPQPAAQGAPPASGANPNDPASYLRTLLASTPYGPQGLAGLQLAPGYRLQTDSSGAQRGRIYDPTGRQWDVFDPVEGRTAADNWNTNLRGSTWNVRDAGMPTQGGSAVTGGGLPSPSIWRNQPGTGQQVLNPMAFPIVGPDIIRYLAMQLGLQNVLGGQGY